MSRPTIITISGKPGSGKSSTADRVAELLGYTRHSSGDIVRQLVKEQGITLAQFNRRAATDASYDDLIDHKLRDLRTQNDIVVDSRLGFYWIPESFKVYLDLDMDVATARIFKDAVRNENRASETASVHSIVDARKHVNARMNAEMRRFSRKYGINPYDTTHFDLVVNTSRHSPQTVALTVFDTYKQWLRSKEWRQVKSAVPMGYSYDTD